MPEDAVFQIGEWVFPRLIVATALPPAWPAVASAVAPLHVDDG
jgi:hypothetical protein